MSRKEDDGRVVVAVKVRPLSEQEVADGCQSCIYVGPAAPQVTAGPHSFTYDQVYGGEGSNPDDLVADCIAPLLDGLFNGYNATVFAYGQTGSGKTYTMGSAYTPGGNAQGVIPWVIDNLFKRINSMKDVDCTVRCSFVEIHKEEVRDLLYTGAARARPAVTIREVLGSGVVLSGATEKEVKSEEETAAVLEQGTLCRATGATNMNNRSSRSHAVFTITLEQRRLAPTTPTLGAQANGGSSADNNGQGNGGDDSDDDSVVDEAEGVDSFLCAKMHLVDLAGSERAKRTKAQGQRLREGIHINRGLFALGSVISALVDGQRHIPYRDSKLTRLLQDSLGGNSRTVMLACISPADVNLDETVSTLRYADRARHIKNKPVVNRDPNAAALSHLRQQIAQLRAENNALRQAIGPDVNVQALLETQIDSTSVAVIEELQQKIINMEVDHTRQGMDLERERRARKLATDSLLEAQKERDQYKLILDQLGIGDPKAFLEQQMEGAGVPAAVEQLLSRDSKDGSILERMQHHYLERIAHLEQQLKSEQQMKASLLIRADSGAGSMDMPSLVSLSMTGGLGGDRPPSDMSDAMAARDHESLQELLHKEQTKKLITARLQEQMDAVNQKIINKDKLIKQMQEQSNGLRMKEQYDKKLKDLQSELESVTKERTALVQKNAELQTMTVEERKKVEATYKERLAHMDDKIKKMKEKEAEYKEIARTKNQADALVSKLQNELMSLKQQKISLQKKVEEAQKDFLLWKQQHEREVQMLRKKGRRDAIELQKVNALAAKRLAILQRKSSEAEAARKRIKDLLDKNPIRLRDMSMTAASREPSTANGNGIECQPNPEAPLLRTENARRAWVEEQLALCSQSQEYKKMMDGEIAERGEFSRQLREVQKKVSIVRNDTPPTPIPGLTQATPDRTSVAKNLIREPLEKLLQQQAELEREINIRNKNIAELQAAWAQAKSEEESKGAGAADAKRWTGLRGILECREFLRTVFRTAHDYRVQSADLQLEADRLQEELDLVSLKYDASREELASAKRRNAELLAMVGSMRNDQTNTASPDAEGSEDEAEQEAATLLLRMSQLKSHKVRSSRPTDASDAEDDVSVEDPRSTRRSLHNTLLEVPTSRDPVQSVSTPVNAWQPIKPQPSSVVSTGGQVDTAPCDHATQMDIDEELQDAEDSDPEASDDSDTDDPSYEPKRGRNSNRTSKSSLQGTSLLADMTPYEKKEWEQEVLSHINICAQQQGLPPVPKLTTKVLKDHLAGKVLGGKPWRPGRKTKDQLILDYRELAGMGSSIPAASSSRSSYEPAIIQDEVMQDASIPSRRAPSIAPEILPLDKHRELYKQRRSQANITIPETSFSSFTAVSSPRAGAAADQDSSGVQPPASPALLGLMERKWRSQERLGALKSGKN